MDNEPTISVSHGDQRLAICSSTIGIPEGADESPGKMILWTTDSPSHRKHTLHALIQSISILIEENELEVEPFPGAPFIVSLLEESAEVTKGVVACKTADGSFHVYAHEGTNTKGLLRAAHKYCTRWIRLDVR